MNLSNVAKHLLSLTEAEYGLATSVISVDETFISQQLFEVLKSFKDCHFNELYSYETLEFDDEFHDITDENESNEDIDDYAKNEQIDILNNFTLNEMKVVID